MKIKSQEIRRQLVHFLYGPLLILLHHYQVLTPLIFLLLILLSFLISYRIKQKQERAIIGRILKIFERDHHFKTFPGQGPIFFTLGAYLSLLLFQTEIAYASIMILSVGDSVSHLIGRYFGKIKTPLHPEKYIEGSIVAFLLSVPFAYAFFPHLLPVVLASLAAMMVELPDLHIFGWDLDDNLTIPLIAGGAMSFFI